MGFRIAHELQKLPDAAGDRGVRAMTSSEGELLAQACRLARLGGWMLERRTTGLHGSREFLAVLGRPADDEPEWEDFLQHFLPPSRSRLEAAVAVAWEQPGEFDLELEVHDLRGVRKWVRVRGEAFPQEGRLFGALQDISLRKQAEIELEQARAAAEWSAQAKARFIAAASHDLRQPLSALALYANTLSRRLGEKHADLLRNMRRCIDGLGGLLGNLLDLSSLDTCVPRVHAEDFAVSALIERLLCAHRPEAEHKGLRLRHRGWDGAAHTDPVLFARIVGNFISNAVRYTDHGGVLVACRRHAGRDWLEVWDTGCGIPDESREEIFREFVRLVPGDQRGGLGLGLAIASRTAQQLGLQLRLHSVPGKGSMFAVELPPGRRSAEATGARVARRPLRVLLMEDNLSVRIALRAALEEAGHSVVELPGRGRGTSVPDALSEAVDLLLIDSPLGQAEACLARIGQLFAWLPAPCPVLVTSGDTDPLQARRFEEAGIPVVYKPLALDSLLAEMAKLTERRGRGGVQPVSRPGYPESGSRT